MSIGGFLMTVNKWGHRYR